MDSIRPSLSSTSVRQNAQRRTTRALRPMEKLGIVSTLKSKRDARRMIYQAEAKEWQVLRFDNRLTQRGAEILHGDDLPSEGEI